MSLTGMATWGVAGREAGIGSEQIVGENAVLAAVEAGRVFDRHRQAGAATGKRLGIRTSAAPTAVGSDHAVGRERRRLSLRAGSAVALVARHLHDPPQHVDEGARNGQVRPSRGRGDVEQHHIALASPCRR